MKIAIDVSPLTSGHKVRGVGFYTKNLIEALGNKVKAVDFQTEDLTKYDIIHYSYFDLFFHTLPIRKPAKTVVTIHDVIPLVYPIHYPPGIRGKLNFYLQRLSLQSVSEIITDTETSKKDICRFLSVQPDKVHVVYLAPREIFKKVEVKKQVFVKEKYNLPDRFVLYVGDVNYNKNIPTLLSACKLAKMPLVICGKQAKEIDGRNLNHPELTHLKNVDFDKVLRLGFVPDEDLVAICNLATLYCQPSFYEGFGLPVLEAFASGTPVVAAKTQALVEVAGGSALFADPKSSKDMADKITKIENDKSLRKSLISAGYERIKAFSWEKTARQTLDVYKKVYENR